MPNLCDNCSHFDRAWGKCRLHGTDVHSWDECSDHDTAGRRATAPDACFQCRHLSFDAHSQPYCSKYHSDAYLAVSNCEDQQSSDTESYESDSYEYGGSSRVDPEPFVGWSVGVVLHLLIILATFICCFFIGRFHTNDEMLPKIFIAAVVVPCVGGLLHGISKPWQPSFSALMGVAVAANLFLVTWEVDVRHPEYVIMAVLFAFIGFWIAMGLDVLFSKITNFIFRVESSSY